MDDQLADEMQHYYNDKNKSQMQRIGSLEAEVGFLQKRIEAVEGDIRPGMAKPYHQEMLNEMQQEIAEKMQELDGLSSSLQGFSMPEEFISSVKYDMQTMIGLLDAEVPNPQVLNQLALKFVSKVFIQRETKQLYMTLQFRMNDEVVLEKVIVAVFE